MIVRESPMPWQLLFIMQGSIIPAILPQLLLVIAVAVVITAGDLAGWFHLTALSPLAFSLIGIALSIFAGFRNSASYERWWEARKILGQHVVEMRSLTREVMMAFGPIKGARMLCLMVCFIHAFKAHLNGSKADAADPYCLKKAALDLAQPTANLPDKILTAMGLELMQLKKRHWLEPQFMQVIEERMVSVSGVLAAAERIKNTPLPFAYSLLLHRTAYLFCFLLPFGLVENAGAWTPAFTAIVAYTFFGLDALGDELAAPFGTGSNGLPLNAISRTIEIGILENLGKTALPQPLVPKHFVLD